MVNLPALFTCAVATSARLSSIFLQAAGFCSVASARAAAMPDLLMAMAPFIAGAMALSEGWARATCLGCPH